VKFIRLLKVEAVRAAAGPVMDTALGTRLLALAIVARIFRVPIVKLIVASP